MTGNDRWTRFRVTDSGCWEWSGYRDRNGYSRMIVTLSDGRRECWAHRAFYDHFKGPIPAGLEIDHTCENPPCVNPDHLEAVTKLEHCRRTMERLGKDDIHKAAALLRRHRLKYREIAEVLSYSSRSSAFSAIEVAIKKGLIDPDDVPRRRLLTDDEKADIRMLFVLGLTHQEISDLYAMSASHVSRVVAGKEHRANRGAA